MTSNLLRLVFVGSGVASFADIPIDLNLTGSQVCGVCIKLSYMTMTALTTDLLLFLCGLSTASLL